MLTERFVAIPDDGAWPARTVPRSACERPVLTAPPPPPPRFPPPAVTVAVKARTVTVTGPAKGSAKPVVLTRAFKTNNFAAQVMTGKKGEKLLKVQIWFGKRDEISCLRTICTHIENMIKGVTTGFEYKMRFAFAHFPINVTVSKDGDKQFVEVRNFLGERKLRKVQMAPTVSVKKSENVKDEITISGSSLELVSMSAANVHASCLIKNKDIRKFLDGLYVSEKGQTGKTISLM